MNILCPTRITPREVEKLMRFFTRRYSDKLRRLCVDTVEMRVLIWASALGNAAATDAASPQVPAPVE